MIAISMYSGSGGIIKARKIVVLVAMFAAPTAYAQQNDFKFELTPFAGFAAGGEFEDSTTTASLELDDSAAFGLILNIDESANTQWEILYSLQTTEADTTGLPVSGAPLDIDVHYFQGGGTYLFDGNAARPFLAATIGASHFEPGLSGVDSETFFAFSIGTGLQIRPNERFGIRLEARAYGTLLNSESNLFCQSGPAGAICAVRVEGSILWQWHAFAGFTFRF